MKAFIKNNEINRYNNQQNLPQTLENLVINNYSSFLKKEKVSWDNIAVIILQDLDCKGIKVADKIIEKINSNASYNDLILQHVTQQLYAHPNYHLFLEKFALKLSGSKERVVSLLNLKKAGINNLHELEKIFREFLLEQKKLAKSAPNLGKIKDEDDFEQLIDFLVTNPLYENFLHAFTHRLAYEFNGFQADVEVVEPEVPTRESLLHFLQDISTDITLQIPSAERYKKGMLYVALNSGYLNYSALKNDGEFVHGVIRLSEISQQIDEQITEEELKQFLPNIIKITAARGHTSRLALNNTSSLRDRAVDFIKGEFDPELYTTNLPPNYFIQKEEAKFILNQWLNAGNLPQVIHSLIDDSYLRAIQQLDRVTEQAKNHDEMSSEIKVEMDAVCDLMKEITHLIASLDKQVDENDDELNSHIQQLISHFKKIKKFYDKTPLLLPNEAFPKTQGNFSKFVKNIIFNELNNEIVEYSFQGEVWRLEWDSLIDALLKDSYAVQIYNHHTSKGERLRDTLGHLIPAEVIFREELKINLLAHLKQDCLYYHKQALQNYQKEQLPTENKDIEKELSLPHQPFNLPTITLEEARREAYRQYNMRHVLTLKSYKAWTSKEKQLQQIHNRILQPNFMEGIIDEQLRHAQIAQEEWLTDVLVPRLTTALYLNIAARLITDYRIDIEDVNKVAQQLWFEISASDISDKLIADWQTMTGKLAPFAESHFYEDCLEKAKQRMSRIYPDVVEDTFDYDFKFKSCFEMEKNKLRKRLVNEVIATFLDKYLDQFAKKTDIQKKTQLPIGKNKDYVFIGPAASGKSTISNQYISQGERLDYVSMATDDYRGIYLPVTDGFECQETDQMFIRTQDSAYLVSELVEDRMRSLVGERPNIIVDGVTYKPAHRALVETNNNSVIVCACLDDVSEVVKRSYNRAIQEDSSSADKGRHVNTTSLLHMHKTASIALIAYCAPDTKIAIYNTNIHHGESPPLIATIDTHGAKTLTINDEKKALLHVTSFFNKKRLNIRARNNSSLFISQLQKPQFQIESLFTVLNYGFKIALNDGEGKSYLTFKKGGNESIEMTILNPEQIKERLSHAGSECQLLKMMLLYGQYGCLKEVRKQCLIQDADSLIEGILNKVLPDQRAEITNQMV